MKIVGVAKKDVDKIVEVAVEKNVEIVAEEDVVEIVEVAVGENTVERGVVREDVVEIAIEKDVRDAEVVVGVVLIIISYFVPLAM